MKYRQLANLKVSALGLGCMPMSGSSADGGVLVYGEANESEAIATLQNAIDIGVNFFDTAEAYGPYHNERLIGRAIRRRRNVVVIGTKFGYRIDGNGRNAPGIDGSPAHARSACEGALRRLGVDALDLFYLHRVDPQVLVEESVGGMAELVKEGKVRHLGLCEVNSKTLRRAHAVHPISAVQSEYSLWERGVEQDILPTVRELGIGFVAFSPLGRGFLTGSTPSATQLKAGDLRRGDPRYAPENYAANLHVLNKVKKVARRHGASPARVALAWLLSRGTDIIPIPGTKRRVTMQDSIAAIDVELLASDIAELEAAAPVNSTFGDRYSPAAMKLVRV